MRIHKSDAFAESVVFNHSVRIQKQNILSSRNPNRLIISLCKAYIVFVGDYFHLRKLRREHLQRAVNGVVVDHKHLTFNTLHGATHRIKALFEEMLDVVIHYDYRKFHHLLLKLQRYANYYFNDFLFCKIN